MRRRCVEELLFHMPSIERQATDEWVKGFAQSIRTQSRRRNWKPSTKQMEIMQRLVSDLFSTSEELELIEQ